MEEKLRLIQQAYLDMGEPVTGERLRELAETVANSPESLLRLIEAVGTVRETDEGMSAGQETTSRIPIKQIHPAS